MEHNIQDEYDAVGHSQPSLGKCFLVARIVDELAGYVSDFICLFR